MPRESTWFIQQSRINNQQCSYYWGIPAATRFQSDPTGGLNEKPSPLVIHLCVSDFSRAALGATERRLSRPGDGAGSLGQTGRARASAKLPGGRQAAPEPARCGGADAGKQQSGADSGDAGGIGEGSAAGSAPAV